MTPAESYHAAVKRLAKAESAHRKSLDALNQAIADRASSQTGYLRRDCEKTETALAEALQAAHAAHRAYWQGRRDELREELEVAANVIREYDALARAAGDISAHPAMQVIQGFLIPLGSAVPMVEDVPVEAPDCALLEDERGAWRP